MKDGTLLKYVETTKLPHHYNAVHYVYMSYNIKGCHWVLVVIDMVVGQILVWDSLHALTSDAKLSREMDNMRTILTTLLEKSGVLLTNPNLHVTP